jgi:hypothetical protein
MTRTKTMRAFFQRIAKLNAPQGGKVAPGGEHSETVATGHQPEPESAGQAVQPVESGLIQRKF